MKCNIEEPEKLYKIAIKKSLTLEEKINSSWNGMGAMDYLLGRSWIARKQRTDTYSIRESETGNFHWAIASCCVEKVVPILSRDEEET